ncbi:TetR family transcriptional regulator [Arthrobacter pityocampae]|uniref:TetR family transcriptional regulator n=1 Tax=Arthrobacter pityocampae TaxID=547334 RepID=A0A2S5IW87_9MICC|nr:TetR/AcrR family transcriptional regulator [Arthrobacter pityocampae]PPB48797.1 TetR family transcriptional regulator [Arthrobacter pityocampae]
MRPSEHSAPNVGAVPGPRPLRRDARHNREVVLAAARRMFAVHGADCSFEDIARDAGVGVGTVYRRFPDRRTLIEAVLVERVADVDAAVSRALALEDPWAAARLFIGAVARMQLEDRGLRELLHEDGFVSAGLAMLRRRIAPAAEDFAARLRHEGARPDLTGDDVLVLIRMLGSLPPEAGAAVPDTGFERYLGLVLDGVRRRSAAEGSAELTDSGQE